MRERGGLLRPGAVLGACLALALPGLPSAPARPPAIGPTRIVPAEFRAPGTIPRLVFVSRAPAPGGFGVPGLGPAQRAIVTGGRLRVRERDGRIRDLLPEPALFDVSDPAVSFDARRIAFSGTPHPDSAWRIYLVDADGRGLRAVTRTDRVLPGAGADAARRARYDDLDPCWIGAERLCFASTRYPMSAQYAELPATNLFVVSTRLEDAGAAPQRITAERNGAEEPALDPRSGEIVYSRWWFNRFRPTRPGEPEAAERDSVNLWHAIALTSDGPRLRCGSVKSRRAMMAYQITFLPDGTPVAACALNLGLWPRPGPLAIQRFGPAGAAVERIAGAVLPDSLMGGYSEALGLAAPAACAPAALPDGRVVFSHDPGGRGDFGLWVVRPGRPGVELVNLPGTLELDAAPLAPRPHPRALVHFTPLSEPAPRNVTDLGSGSTFDYQSAGMFRAGPRAPGAPAWARGTRIRFFAAPPPVESRSDTAVLIRELEVGEDGQVDARGLPADMPLFEQLVGADGFALRAAHGPAHVAGFNAGTPGGRSRCVGCHLGHSALPLPASATFPGRKPMRGGGTR